MLDRALRHSGLCRSCNKDGVYADSLEGKRGHCLGHTSEVWGSDDEGGLVRPSICRNGILLSRAVFPGRLDLLRLCFDLQGDCRLCSLPFLLLCKYRGLSSSLAILSPVSCKTCVSALIPGAWSTVLLIAAANCTKQLSQNAIVKNAFLYAS